MKTFTISLFLSLLWTLTSAQTPDDFPIQSDQPLTVTYQSSDTTIKIGQLYAQQKVAKAPTLSGANTDKDGTYVAIMVDATYPYLHLIAPGLVAKSGDGQLQTDNDGDEDLVGCPYLSPAPPATDGPHEYVILLYEQPDGWAIPDAYSDVNPPSKKNDRSGFDVNDFVGASGLTTLVGSNYFRVEPDSSTPSPTGAAKPSAASPSAASPSAASASASATATGTSTNAASAFQFRPVLWLLTGLLLLRAF